MATIATKVCDECGKRSVHVDGWLVVSGIDIRSAASGDSLTMPDRDVDLCSLGCLLRYITKHVDRWTNSSRQPLGQEDRADTREDRVDTRDGDRLHAA